MYAVDIIQFLNLFFQLQQVECSEFDLLKFIAALLPGRTKYIR